MAGTSEREKALKSIYQRAGAPAQFGYDRMMSEINKGTQFGINQQRQAAAEQGGQLAQSTAANLQSRGIGGSILNSAMQRAKLNANKNAGNNIQQLLLRKMMMTPQIMQNMNQLDLQKLGLQAQAGGNLSDDTWFDDMLAIINTAGNVAGAFI